MEMMMLNLKISSSIPSVRLREPGIADMPPRGRPKKSVSPTEPQQPHTPSKRSEQRKRPTPIPETPNEGETKDAPIYVQDELEQIGVLPSSQPRKALQLEIDQWRFRLEGYEKDVAQSTDNLAWGDRETRRRLELSHQKETDYANLLQECEKLSTDNLALREYIHRTRDRQPTHTDEEYITRIQSLNESTKSWIASLSKSRRSENLETDQPIVWEALVQTCHGRDFCRLLIQNPEFFEVILLNRQLRSLLVRQLIWSIMADSVFRPFCFGLKEPVSELLNNAVETILEQGTVSSHPLY